MTAGDRSAERKWRRALRAIRQTKSMHPGAMTESEARQQAVVVGNNGHTAAAQTWTEVADEIATPSGTRTASTDPVINISTKQGFIVEGETATFTLHASSAPSSPIQVDVRMSSVVGWPLQNKHSITVSSQGDTTFTVPTRVIDTHDIGTLNAVIFQGSGYLVGSPHTAGMPVRNAPDPAVDVSRSGAIIEGENAVFTFTAVPPPNAPLPINISVIETGDVAATSVASTTSIVIPPSGTTTLTFATVDDSAQEVDGKIIVHVEPGSGYTQRYGQHSGAGITVLDNDGPAVSVSANALSVAEGGEAVFVFTTTPVTKLLLEVKVRVTQTGDVAAGSLPRQATVLIQPGGGNPALKIATVDDSVQEDDGAISVTIEAATKYSGYVVGTSTATIVVTDDDAGSTNNQQHQQQQQQADSNFTPDQALVDTVQQKADNHSNAGASARLQKIVDGMTGNPGGYTSQECRDTADHHGVSSVWTPWCDEIERREHAASSNTPPPPDPEVSITAGSGVTEGSPAMFTLTASPAPASPLDVSVDVTQSGDFTATGPQTFTIPTTGSVTFGVATTDDGADESDGSITVTLHAGSGYRLGSSNAATVAVSDNDDAPVQRQHQTQTDTSALAADIQERITLTLNNGDTHSNNIWRRALAAVRGEDPPNGLSELTAAIAQRLADNHNRGGRTELAELWQSIAGVLNGNTPPPPPPPPPPDPELSITGSAGVVEGGTIIFTISATPSPSSALTVGLELTESGSFASTGSRVVTLPISGVATLAVATTDDNLDESDGSVTATLTSGSGYTIGSQPDATVSVSDNDDPPPATPELSISGDSDVTEGGDAVFTITATPAPSGALTISVNVTQSGDFASVGTHRVTIKNGTATLTIATVNDGVDETNGSVTATLESGNGYTLGSSSSATINVSDNDDPPQPPPPPPPERAGSLNCDNSGVKVDEFTVTERWNGYAFFRVTIELCEPYYGPKYIDYEIEHITTNDRDLLTLGGTLVIGSFEQSKHVTVTVKSDSVAEGDETFALVFTNADPSSIDLGPARVLGTITDP